MFHEPTPDLRINLEGQGAPAQGSSNYALQVRYNNDGWATAPGVVITQTLEGMTYISDTPSVCPIPAPAFLVIRSSGSWATYPIIT